ncbi:membrane protein S23 [Saimiriine betaherpesvirus 4]|uniref:Membrane protein S23 n=1 Tax=Saimiriine betaherpesvirus 4 TaxID=1535247 RepID=G8XT49_9BETA|nr:membrane protein S23 [Saimiriine betaherpesvirus 4]AEV80998.1 membrane protein S23 [Saimiriine betaherpesvirus 4]
MDLTKGPLLQDNKKYPETEAAALHLESRTDPMEKVSTDEESQNTPRNSRESRCRRLRSIYSLVAVQCLLAFIIGLIIYYNSNIYCYVESWDEIFYIGPSSAIITHVVMTKLPRQRVWSNVVLRSAFFAIGLETSLVMVRILSDLTMQFVMVAYIITLSVFLLAFWVSVTRSRYVKLTKFIATTGALIIIVLYLFSSWNDYILVVGCIFLIYYVFNLMVNEIDSQWSRSEFTEPSIHHATKVYLQWTALCYAVIATMVWFTVWGKSKFARFVFKTRT